MELKLLGTSAGEGYPGYWCECENCTLARKLGGKNIRGNSSALLDGDVLLDMNANSVNMFARMDVHPLQLQTLLVTHAHRDHFMPYFLQWRSMAPKYRGVPEAQLHKEISACFRELPWLDIYGNAFVEEALTQDAEVVGKEEICKFHFHRVEAGKTIQIRDLEVTPVRSIHTEIYGFAFNYIIHRGDKTLLYALDAGGWEPEMMEIIFSHKYDCVVMEGTFGLGAEVEGHMCLEKNKRFLSELTARGCWADRPNLWLTHIAPHWAPPHDLYSPIVEKAGMHLGYDGVTIRF